MLNIVNSGFFVLALPVIEALVACWVALRRPSPAGFLFLAGLFGVFASTAAVLLARGVSSCGCFGAIEVSPFGMLAVDLTLGGLCVYSVAQSPERQSRACFLALPFCAVVLFGTGFAVASKLMAEEDVGVQIGDVGFTPFNVAMVEEGVSGSVEEIAVSLTNNTREPILFEGATQSCAIACPKLRGPLTLAAGDTVGIVILAKRPKQLGFFTSDLELFYRFRGGQRLVVRCFGFSGDSLAGEGNEDT